MLFIGMMCVVNGLSVIVMLLFEMVFYWVLLGLLYGVYFVMLLLVVVSMVLMGKCVSYMFFVFFGLIIVIIVGVFMVILVG